MEAALLEAVPEAADLAGVFPLPAGAAGLAAFAAEAGLAVAVAAGLAPREAEPGAEAAALEPFDAFEAGSAFRVAAARAGDFRVSAAGFAEAFAGADAGAGVVAAADADETGFAAGLGVPGAFAPAAGFTVASAFVPEAFFSLAGRSLLGVFATFSSPYDCCLFAVDRWRDGRRFSSSGARSARRTWKPPVTIYGGKPKTAQGAEWITARNRRVRPESAARPTCFRGRGRGCGEESGRSER